LLPEIVVVQPEPFWSDVIATVVIPVFVRSVDGTAKVPSLAPMVNVAVLAVAVFAPPRS
jgi:hypothetical protein